MVAESEQIVPDTSATSPGMSDPAFPALVTSPAGSSSPSANAKTPTRTELLVAKVSSIPMVNSTISTLSRVYESSKSSSPLIKYGAETVESGVHRIVSLVDSPSAAAAGSGAATPANASSDADVSMNGASSPAAQVPQAPTGMYATGRRYLSDTVARQIDGALAAAESAVDRYLPPVSLDETDSEGVVSDAEQEGRVSRVRSIGSRVQGRLQKRAVTRWNNIYGQGYDSLQSVRQSVAMLKVAEEHIARQTQLLQEQLAAVTHYLSSTQQRVSEARMRALQHLYQVVQSIKLEIVGILRRAVDAISRTAVLMPSYLQTRIKDLLLMLPNRMGAIAGASAAAPDGSLNDESRLVNYGKGVVSLANETVHMLQSVTGIFTQYIDRTGAFLETFNFGNFQGNASAAATAASAAGSSPLPRILPKPAASSNGGDDVSMTPPASPMMVASPSPALGGGSGLESTRRADESQVAVPNLPSAVPEAEAALVLSSLASAATVRHRDANAMEVDEASG